LVTADKINHCQPRMHHAHMIDFERDDPVRSTMLQHFGEFLQL